MPTIGIPYAPSALRNGRPVDVCPVCHELIPGSLRPTTASRYFLHYSSKHNGVTPTPAQFSEALAIAKRMVSCARRRRASCGSHSPAPSCS